MSYITSTLMLLEDAGLMLNRPGVTKVTLCENGQRQEEVFIKMMSGRRVSIENNPIAKFLLIFSMFDFYIDSNHPKLAGKSYYYKYKKSQKKNDFDIILWELFRIAKIIRNTLIHEPDKFEIKEIIDIEYLFKDTKFSLKIPLTTLSDLCTLIVMFIERKNNNTEYFLGIARYIYNNIIISSIQNFRDEFGETLKKPKGSFMLIPYHRYLAYKAKSKLEEECLTITESHLILDYINKSQSYDFCVTVDDVEYKIPLEALDESFSIHMKELSKWRI
ncbi:hypothetical protein [Klebsiella michiganensis]|uniref:hypothetical protein n=1 Tax=Klebsiella michiganensis TaxID=1134687 RepID=UPI001F0EE72B|nr:hypothetical protein [Klebsiella michiganensis]MDU7370222.1 hypothetical protein [Klebsiella michiganensis]